MSLRMERSVGAQRCGVPIDQNRLWCGMLAPFEADGGGEGIRGYSTCTLGSSFRATCSNSARSG
jgi:hypothetical protein